MYKKLIGFVLALTLVVSLIPMAFAQEQDTDVGGVIAEEVFQWAKTIEDVTKGEALLNDSTQGGSEGIYTYEYPSATLHYNTPTLTSESVLLSVQVTNGTAQGPRGVQVGATINNLLAAYANENENLQGNKNFAVLYANGAMPQSFMWAWVMRGGQDIYGVEYGILEPTASGDGNYTYCGFYFDVSEGIISGITAFGLKDQITAAQAQAQQQSVETVAQDQSYFAYPSSMIGTDLEPFNREDMMFGGVDYLGITPETAVEVFGQPTFEEYIQDGNEWMRTFEWEGMELIFAYDSNKNLVGVDTVMIYGGQEGPRGVKSGDSLSSVIKRFRFGEGQYDGAVEPLYGAEGEANYGVAEYGNNGEATLRYITTLEGEGQSKQMMLYLVFSQGILVEILLSNI